MAGTSVDQRLDALYAVPLAEFVSARKRLAAELKDAGDGAGAKIVQASGKPTLSAWITNQTVRRAPELVQRLLQVSGALAGAQRALAPAVEARRDFQAALIEQRQAVSRLLDVAAEVIATRGSGGPATEGVRQRVEKNLRWGALSDGSRATFARGRLTEDVPAPGFEALLGAAAPEGSPRRSGGGGSPTARKSATLPEPPAGRPAQQAAERTRRANEQAQQAAAHKRLADKRAQEAVARRAREQREAAMRTALRSARAHSAETRRALERVGRARSASEARVQAAAQALVVARAAHAAAQERHQAAEAAAHAAETQVSALERDLAALSQPPPR